MIPNASTDTKVTSTMTGERGRFTIHAQAHEKMMGVLTNLYEDPEGAVVREYLTNALDAQIEAQEANPDYVWRPVEVSTPSAFARAFKVRDFGTGMDADDIKNVYSQYGYSTKEHTNDQTGMLGLGSKCALTYTGQFTVTGWKNGVKTVAIISLNEDEVPEYIILDESASDDPSGVEISIPVRDRDSLAEKTRDFLRWWNDGLVLVDGAEPVKHGFSEVRPGVFITEKENAYYFHSAESYVIMGNVPYTVDSEYVDEDLRSSGIGFAAYVPMGSVDFPPNRERLRYNGRTKKAVKEISAGLFEEVLDKKIKHITDADSFKEAYKRWNDASIGRAFRRHAKFQQLTYCGEPFSGRIQTKVVRLTWDYNERSNLIRYDNLGHGEAVAATLIVTGVKHDSKPSSYFKKKVAHYIDENINDGRHLRSSVLLVEDDLDSPWCAHVPRVTAATIKAVKLPKDGTAGTKPRVETPYDFYMTTFNGDIVRKSETKVPSVKGKTIVYISPQDIRETYRKAGCTPYQLLEKMGKDDYILVVLGSNRFGKFTRNHKKAVPVSGEYRKVLKRKVDNITDAEYQVGMLSISARDFFKSYSPSDFKDPALAALAEAAVNNTGNGTASARNMVDFAMRSSIRVGDIKIERDNIKNPLDEYPLFDISWRGANREDNLLYMNLLYEHRQGLNA